VNIDYESGYRYDIGNTKIIDDIKNIIDKDVLLFNIKFVDFVRILNINFEYNFTSWFDRYVEQSNGLLDNNYVSYKYSPEFNFKEEDTNKKYLYDLTKYYYFLTNNIKEYRVPIGVLKNNNNYIVHPGNARLNCMFHWDDNSLIKLLITDYQDPIIQKLKEISSESFSFHKDSSEVISNYLNIESWRNVFVRFTPEHGLELGEQHDSLKEFDSAFKIEYYKDDCILVNDFKIMYKQDNSWRLAKPL
jgi:hypothetical protein